MVDHQFAEPCLAVLYDLFCPWDPRGDFGFYLPLVMAAKDGSSQPGDHHDLSVSLESQPPA